MLFLYFFVTLLGLVAAESGLDGWLRYAPLPPNILHSSVPSLVISLNSTQGSPVLTAGEELQKGVSGILSKPCQHEHDQQHKSYNAIIVGTLEQYAARYGQHNCSSRLVRDGFWLSTKGDSIEILGQNERGALYGAFEYLSMLAQGNFSKVEYASNPDAQIRWTNEWDNMDGSIERGFAGASIFFSNGTIVANLTRAAQYARLLASIRVNGVVVNNVNANATTLSPRNIEGLGRIADVFRPYGIQLGLSLYFASPIAGVQGRQNLTTFDPLDPSVVQWWVNTTNDIYARIPDMAGYLLKANSEGQPGPTTYNRTLAEGANLIAKAIRPHGGIVMFRAFVYDYQNLNESVWKDDRAKAAVDYFKPLDGDFDDNVVVQIKYGPIDFQVREPVSPLFSALRNTSTAIELQVTQEYLGQQCHLVYLPPLWQTILGFDLRADDQLSFTRDIVSGRTFDRPLGGYAGVVNVGTNETWLGSHLAMSNLYGYGRLAWKPTLDSTSILQDWIRLTFGLDPKILSTVTSMSMSSWHAHENYTGNLGLQSLTDILYTHYGPNPQTQDNTPWGQWTRADTDSIGMDRTVSNGTGFSGQYAPEIATRFENIATTPDDLILWFHHLPWTHVLKSGQTIIQHIYDAHYTGSSTVHAYPSQFSALEPLIDSERYTEILSRLHYQASHALVWRDAIVNFYHDVTSIPDAAGRVGQHPYRIEAEDMTLAGYKTYCVAPFEVASGSMAIVAASNETVGTATTTLDQFESGRYDVGVNYFDLHGGAADYSLMIGGKEVGRWTADERPWYNGVRGPSVLGHTPSVYLDGHSAIRTVFENVTVNKGDELKIVGTPDRNEPAALDYVVLLPVGKGIVD